MMTLLLLLVSLAFDDTLSSSLIIVITLCPTITKDKYCVLIVVLVNL